MTKFSLELSLSVLHILFLDTSVQVANSANALEVSNKDVKDGNGPFEEWNVGSAVSIELSKSDDE